MFLTSPYACVLHPGNTPFFLFPQTTEQAKWSQDTAKKVHDVLLLFSVVFPEESHVTHPDLDPQATCLFTWINWVIQFEFRHVRSFRVL